MGASTYHRVLPKGQSMFKSSNDKNDFMVNVIPLIQPKEGKTPKSSCIPPPELQHSKLRAAKKNKHILVLLQQRNHILYDVVVHNFGKLTPGVRVLIFFFQTSCTSCIFHLMNQFCTTLGQNSSSLIFVPKYANNLHWESLHRLLAGCHKRYLHKYVFVEKIKFILALREKNHESNLSCAALLPWRMLSW